MYFLMSVVSIHTTGDMLFIKGPSTWCIFSLLTQGCVSTSQSIISNCVCVCVSYINYELAHFCHLLAFSFSVDCFFD